MVRKQQLKLFFTDTRVIRNLDTGTEGSNHHHCNHWDDGDKTQNTSVCVRFLSPQEFQLAGGIVLARGQSRPARRRKCLVSHGRGCSRHGIPHNQAPPPQSSLLSPIRRVSIGGGGGGVRGYGGEADRGPESGRELLLLR